MKKKLACFGLGFVLVLIAIAVVMNRRESIQNRVLDTMIRKLQPSLPFQVKSYRLAKDLSTLQFELLWSGHSISIDGALQMNWLSTAEGWTIHYTPTVTVDGTSPLHLVVEGKTPTDFASLKSLQVHSDSAHPDASWKSKALGLEIQKPKVDFTDDPANDRLQIHLSADGVAWSAPHAQEGDDHAINLTALSVDGTREGDRYQVHLASRGAEVLWGSFYADLPLKSLPLSVETSDFHTFQASLGKAVQINVQDSGMVAWKTNEIAFAPLARWASQTFGFSDLQYEKGTLRSSGSARIDPATRSVRVQELKLDGKNISFRDLARSLWIRGMSFSVHDHSGWVEIPKIALKRITATLRRTKFTASETALRTESAIPLEIDGIPQFRLGALNLKFHPNADDAYIAHTSLSLSSPNLDFLTRGLCLNPAHVPPAGVRVDFSEVTLSPGVIDPTGTAEADLFGGTIQLHDLGLYDLATDVPEIDFDVDWSRIDLEKLTRWANFGTMKGTLEGYAHDVVFQSFLPTQYEFQVDLQSLDQNASLPHIDVSPEAMKNIVMLFTGADLDEQIPGIASWLMFGWLPHLIGGYDVYYAGFAMTSEDGLIRLETLDLPSIYEKTQKHFFLYGPRFKMPLKASEYPLIVDATSMSNFVHRMLMWLEHLQDQKRDQKTKGDFENENDSNECQPLGFGFDDGGGHRRLRYSERELSRKRGPEGDRRLRSRFIS